MYPCGAAVAAADRSRDGMGLKCVGGEAFEFRRR